MRRKMVTILETKSDLESRQDMLSNELSWSSFGHREDLQILAAKRDFFLDLALRPCTLVLCPCLKVKKKHKELLKRIFWRLKGQKTLKLDEELC